MLGSDRPRFLGSLSAFLLSPKYQVCPLSVNATRKDVNRDFSGTEGGNMSGVTDIAEVTSLVSSVVIESENNIVLDFSTKTEDGDLGSEINEDDLSSTPNTARSDASSTSLLTKVIKVSIPFFLSIKS